MLQTVQSHLPSTVLPLPQQASSSKNPKSLDKSKQKTIALQTSLKPQKAGASTKRKWTDGDNENEDETIEEIYEVDKILKHRRSNNNVISLYIKLIKVESDYLILNRDLNFL